jgi:hypothetical protein
MTCLITTTHPDGVRLRNTVPNAPTPELPGVEMALGAAQERCRVAEAEEAPEVGSQAAWPEAVRESAEESVYGGGTHTASESSCATEK